MARHNVGMTLVPQERPPEVPRTMSLRDGPENAFRDAPKVWILRFPKDSPNDAFRSSLLNAFRRFMLKYVSNPLCLFVTSGCGPHRFASLGLAQGAAGARSCRCAFVQVFTVPVQRDRLCKLCKQTRHQSLINAIIALRIPRMHVQGYSSVAQWPVLRKIVAPGPRFFV